jgi:type VI protein secretion system component VasK
VILAAIVAASVAGPVIAVAAELLRAVLIAAAVILGLGLAGGAALVAWRLRRGRQNAPLVVHQARPVTQRPAESLPAPQRPPIGRAAEVHLHFHGVTAEDAAAILDGRNRPDGPRA